MNTKKTLTILALLVIAGIVVYGVTASRETSEPVVEENPSGTRLMSPIGVWTSMDDAKYVVTFSENDRYTEVYDGDMVTASGTWTMDDATGKAVITLTLDGKTTADTRTWEIIKINEHELEVIHTSGRGNILRFTK